MGTRVSTLKAIFTAETGPAEAGFRKMRSETQSFGAAAGGVFDGLGVGLAQFAGPAGVGLAIAGIAKGALAANALREQVENSERQLTAYAGSAQNAEAATSAFVRAADGGVSRMDAMRMAGQMLGMGLATTSDEVYRMARMAVVLGDQTLGVEERMSNWNAMMANQSLPRLDTYGISSGRVRQRIDELMAANAGLTREQAFTNAVLEIGGAKLALLEAQGVQAASSTAQLDAAVTDLKVSLSELINLEGGIRGVAGAIREMNGMAEGANAAADAIDPSKGADAQLAGIEQRLAYLKKMREENQGTYTRGWNPAANQAEIDKLEAQASGLRLYGAAADDVRGKLDAYLAASMDAATAQDALTNAQIAGDQAQIEYAQAALELANQQRDATLATYQAAAGMAVGSQAADVAADRYDKMAAAALNAADGVTALSDAERKRASANAVLDAGWGSQANMAAYAAAMRGDTQAAAGQRYAEDKRAEAERLAEEQRRTNERLAQQGASAWEREMKSAVDGFENDFKSAMQGGIEDSIGLLDLRQGKGGNPNAPGQNGAFEDIFRLQAFVSGGTWGETAQKYGLDQAGASDVVRKFQSGQWDESVLKVIDQNKLRQQIKEQQVAKTMMDQLAADLAAETNGDPKVVKALLGLGGGSDGGKGAKEASGMDLSAFSSGFLASVDKELEARAGDYEQRGRKLFDALGGGFVKQATESRLFQQGVANIVASVLAEGLDE